MGDAPAARIRYIEDLTGLLTKTTLRDAETRETLLTVAPLLNLPEQKSIIQIKKAFSTLMVIDFSASTTGWGTVTFTFVGSVFSRIEDYLPMRPRSSSEPLTQSRTFIARTGEEYIWSTFRRDAQVVRVFDLQCVTLAHMMLVINSAKTFECISVRDGSFVARYYPLLRSNFNGDDRPAAMMEVEEDHLKSLPELVATLIIVRYIARYPSPYKGGRL